MSDAKQPNIIIFFFDQQRSDSVGCYGQKMEVSPNLDKMARAGVRFGYAFSNQPICGPARACLQVGKYPTELGCFTNSRRLPGREKTLAHFLSDVGYEVGYLGKWHLASDWPFQGPQSYSDKPVPVELRGGYKDFWLGSDTLEFTSHSYEGHMFDSDNKKREFPPGRYRVDAQTDWVLEYLQSRTLEQPFFLFTSYIEPHHQNDHNHIEGPVGSKERFKDSEIPGDLVNMEGDWAQEYPDYLGCCRSLDDNLGRVIEKVQELGIADNTVIIYFSDHGCHFRTRNSEYKRSCHEASIRVPLVICGGDFKGGKVIDNELVATVDVTATVLKIAGVDLPSYMQGRALQELIDDKVSDWPQDVFVQLSEAQVGRAIRTKKWKYSVHAPDKNGFEDSASDVYVEQFLYDLENDPHEQNNLVNDPQYKNVRSELATRLKSCMRKANEQEAEIRAS